MSFGGRLPLVKSVLDTRKDSRAADQGKWVNNEWCWEWEWVRELRGRVGRDFEDLVGLLQNVVISNNCKDRWKWLLQEDGDFTVKGLSKMIEEKTLRIENDGQETLWNKCVPKKVNIFVWRALKGRLPVREELDKRGVDLDSILCLCCASAVDSCNHSLVICNFARSVWEKIFIWWKFGGVNAFSIGEIFSSNGNVATSNLSVRLWQAIKKEKQNGLATMAFGSKKMSVTKLIEVAGCGSCIRLLRSQSIWFCVPALFAEFCACLTYLSDVFAFEVTVSVHQQVCTVFGSASSVVSYSVFG
ncbi:reverse transcriptase domain, reverse transcriptase zinc-binding domain protein [Tanacetum coccineum]